MSKVFVVSEDALEELADKVSWWVETGRGRVAQSNSPRREMYRDMVEEVICMMVASNEFEEVRELETPETRDEETLCKCGKPGTPELHPCPFDSDIHNDLTPRCNCCEACEYECICDT
jgi:hypothetical protein